MNKSEPTPGPTRSHRLRRDVSIQGAQLAAVVAAVAVMGLGCGGGGSKSSGSTTTTTVGTTTSSTGATSSTTSAAAGGLSGTWSGQYSGAYQGTFSLTWQQSGSNLTGTINLSTSPGATDINGTVQGSSIRFGTVGSTAITYSGSVSGNSMSGSYQVETGNGSVSGAWSATRA